MGKIQILMYGKDSVGQLKCILNSACETRRQYFLLNLYVITWKTDLS